VDGTQTTQTVNAGVVATPPVGVDTATKTFTSWPTVVAAVADATYTALYETLPQLGPGDVVDLFVATGQSNAYWPVQDDNSGTYGFGHGIKDTLVASGRFSFPTVVIDGAPGQAISAWWDESVGPNFFYKDQFFDTVGGGTGKLEAKIAEITALGATPRFRGLFWFQGESDGDADGQQNTSEAIYTQRWGGLLGQLEADLGNSDYHFVMNTVGNSGNGINNTLKAITDADARGLLFDTQSLPYRTNELDIHGYDHYAVGQQNAQQFINTFYPITYAVTYDGNGADGGVPPDPQSKSQGVDMSLASNSGALAKDGYVFSGWNTKSDGSGTTYTPGTSYSTDAALTLYASWTALPTYLVSYDGNGASGGTVPADEIKTQGVALTLSDNDGILARSGYSLVGWNTAADGSGTTYNLGARYSLDLPVTFYAVWSILPTYDITYDANGSTGGTVPTAQSKIQGVALTLADNDGSLTKAAYAFTGWNTAADGSGTTYAEGATYVTDTAVTLYALWTILPVYSVNYDGNGAVAGTPPSPQSKIYGLDLTLALSDGFLVKEGFDFGGWNTEADGSGTTYAEGASYANNAAVTLYVLWAPRPTSAVSFKANGATSGTVPPSQVKAVGVNLTLASNSGGLTKDGYALSGWNTSADGSGTAYAEGATYATDLDVTLYATWTLLSTYTVTYNGNGADSGAFPVAQTKTQGVDLSLASNSGRLAKEGATFSGWNTAADGSGTAYAEGAAYNSDADVTLYAVWTNLPIYSVTYDSNGATAGASPVVQAKTQGVTLTLASNSGGLVKDGYTFSGWNTSPDGRGFAYAEGASYITDATMTLYAAWTNLPTYAITYHSSGSSAGAAPVMQTKTQGVSLTLASNNGGLVKEGYTFSGWNTSVDGSGTTYGEGATYVSDVALTLYAFWTIIPTYTVSYDGNGSSAGSVPESQSKTHGVPITLASNSGNLQQIGFTFSGWNTEADGSGNAHGVGTTYVTDAATTLYAVWTPLPEYTVTFQEGSQGSRIGGGALVQTIVQGGAATEPVITAGVGSTFTGWSAAFDNVSSDLTITALYAMAGDVAPVITEGSTISVTLSEDGAPNAFALKLNATDANEGDALSWSVSSEATHGIASANAIGNSVVVEYTPDADHHGEDSFTVAVTDGSGLKDTITVLLTIVAVNDSPLAVSGNVWTARNIAVPIDLIGSDVDGDALNFTLISGPTSGNLSGTAPNFTYIPAVAFSGVDSLRFVVSDGVATSEEAMITIEVEFSNGAPVPGERAPVVQMSEDSFPTAFVLDLNATDPEGDRISYFISKEPSHGTATVNASGVVDYVPVTNWNGSEVFDVTIRDQWNAETIVPVTVQVSAVNDAPVVSQAGNLTVNEASSLTLSTSMLNIQDIEGNPPSWVEITRLPSQGRVLAVGNEVSPGYRVSVMDMDAGALTYMPEAGDYTTEIGLAISDGMDISESVILTVSVEDTSPPQLGEDIVPSQPLLPHSTVSFSFSESVESGSGVGSATNPANYQLDGSAVGGVSVLSVTGSGKGPYTLTFDAPLQNGMLQVSVSGVRDLVGNTVNPFSLERRVQTLQLLYTPEVVRSGARQQIMTRGGIKVTSVASTSLSTVNTGADWFETQQPGTVTLTISEEGGGSIELQLQVEAAQTHESSYQWPDDGQDNLFSLVSFPYDINTFGALRTALEIKLGEMSPSNWLIYHYKVDANGGSYDIPSDNTPAGPTSSWWVGVVGRRSLILEGGGPSMNSQVTLNLRSGWNLVGNPYPVEVSLDQFLLQETDGFTSLTSPSQDLVTDVAWVLNTQRNGYENVTTLAPGQGAWLYNSSASDERLLIDPNGVVLDKPRRFKSRFTGLVPPQPPSSFKSTDTLSREADVEPSVSSISGGGGCLLH
jgi:uncharacterized repeat protein (TIGR02543 family)